ncbi:hypothetical protein KUTeg_011026 [Tegillarca granosa]|uniref:Ribosomal protein eL8/eL30/eS12/Gadd45 domain-containing protein n=1 Tax=Tegillarca granosa TaxID=220873 RepID=A0ABQ9F514_TEGGR|nr:hypothetical protein KUTeg_011026 [Tegillarca granosa]
MLKMARVEIVNVQVSNPSVLSPEAAVFVPRHIPQNEDMQAPLQEVPTYVTNCYPFVQNDGIGRPRGSWNQNGRPQRPNFGSRMSRPFSGHHPGCTRMPGPHKFPVDPGYSLQSPPPPPPPPWTQVVPFTNMLPGSMPGFQNLLNGMPFDGGTGDNMDIVNENNDGNKHDNSRRRNNSGGKKNNGNGNWNEWQTGRQQGYGKRNRERQKSGPRRRNDSGSKVNVAIQNEPNQLEIIDPAIISLKTVLYTETAVQTDFPEKIANLTLIQQSSPLFINSHRNVRKQKRLSDSNESEVDSDSGYSSPLHKRNQVSNGTQPIESMTFVSSARKTLSAQNAVPPSSSVPQQKLSYASIAQRSPSQTNSVKHDTNIRNDSCDIKYIQHNNIAFSVIKEKDVKRETPTKLENKNDKKDLIEGVDGEIKKKRKRNRKRKKKKKNGEENEEMDMASSSKQDVELHFEDDEEFPDLSGVVPKKCGSLSPQSSPLKTRDNNVDMRFQDVTDLEEDSYCNNISDKYHVTNDKSHVTAINRVQSVPKSAPITYSSILQTKKVNPYKSDINRKSTTSAIKDAWNQPQKDQNKHTENSDQITTKAAKKRRKRREMVNKAADDELAEINLEQQVLKAEHLKSKQSKTGSNKESGTQHPGILKVNPQQQSTGGKKSKQLVALDLGAMIKELEKKKDTIPDKKEHTKVTINATATNITTSKPTKDNRVKKEDKVKGARSHNILDSSAPVKRGKEREHPKAKKPSPLKKVILKEREEKKQLRLLDDPEAEHEGAPVGIGVISAESDLSQDALSSKGSMDFGAGTPASADLSPISQTSPISMSPLSPGQSPQSSEVNSPIAGVVGKDVIRKIHSRRFREEVTKHLKLRKIKCVMISPNLEKIQSKGGLDDALNNILNLCNDQDVPFVFALGRRALGRACAKLVPVSVVGIFNYDGTEENFRQLMLLTQKARESYKDMVALVEKEVREYPIKMAAQNVPHIFAHMGHSRTPSGASVLSFTSSILSEPISENYPHSEPETDSKGYEIVKDNDIESFNFSSNISNVLPSSSRPYQFKMPYKHNINEIDDGNEADTEEYGERQKHVRGSSSEEGEYEESFQDSLSQTGSDTVEELPHIDSIHSSSHDLCTDIMSQTSGRTIENCEAMSTHSSRTLGDGSSTILADPGERSKHDTPKSTESPGNTLQRGKVIDEERIKSWVDETQSRLENLQLETSTEGSSDSGSESEEDEKEISNHDNQDSHNNTFDEEGKESGDISNIRKNDDNGNQSYVSDVIPPQLTEKKKFELEKSDTENRKNISLGVEEKEDSLVVEEDSLGVVEKENLKTLDNNGDNRENYFDVDGKRKRRIITVVKVDHSKHKNISLISNF